MEGSGKMQLLDFYRTRFGQAVRHQGNGWNGPCPLCGGEPGRSDRFMIWPERSDNLGEACAKHGITGIWSCRQCGRSGDTIAYLTKIDGLTFREALGQLGIQGEKIPLRRRHAPAEPPTNRINSWTPKAMEEPSLEWQARALKLVEEAEKKIWDCPSAIQWLNARGIFEDAIRTYRLGYLGEESEKYHGRFRPRKAFGLAPKTGQNGKVHDKLFIPRGVLIPTFSTSGAVLNLRIRRHRTDLKENGPKYLEIEGSYHGPLFLQSSLARPLAVYFITEAELDAMLIHHASGGVAGALAVRTNRGKPDSRCNRFLETASRVCVALDYDNAGAEGCDFWEENYTNAVRWPTPEGKDPGDAFALGVDIREWIETALPASVRLPEKDPEVHGSSLSHKSQEIQAFVKSGNMDTTASGQNDWGAGASPNLKNIKGSWPSEARARVEARAMADDWRLEMSRWNETQPGPCEWASINDFTSHELKLLSGALPKGAELDSIFLDVAIIWLLWRELPVAFLSNVDEAGNRTGFSWEFPDKLWGQGKFALFWRHQATSRALWMWLSDHPAQKITSANLLRMWELLAQK